MWPFKRRTAAPSENPIAAYPGFVPIARMPDGPTSGVLAGIASASPYDIEFIRLPERGAEQWRGWIGRSADYATLICFSREVFVFPMSDIVGLRVERILPAKGPGGSSLSVECRRACGTMESKSITICEAFGPDDLTALASALSGTLGLPLRLSPYGSDC